MKTIIRLDDFGMTENINNVFKVILETMPTCNVSVMVNTNFSKEALDYIKTKPIIGKGLHVNISTGKPLSTAESLKNGNRFFSSKEINSFEDIPFDRVDVYNEILAQLNLFEEVTGTIPDYMDLHAINLPIVYDVMKEIGSHFDIPYIENPDNKAILYHHTLFDQYQFYKETNYYYFLDKITLSNQKINHFVFHPGLIDDELISLSSLTEGRLYDLNLLCSTNFSNWIQQNHLELLLLKEI